MSFLVTGDANRRPPKRGKEDNSNTSSISTSEISELVEKLRFDRFRSTTRKNYYIIWKSFNKFYLKLDTKPASWEERLTLFVAYLVKCNRKSCTIKSYISAIKVVLHDIGVVLNQDQYLLMSLTRACQIRNDRIQTKLPISKDLLSLILSKCDDLLHDQMYLNKLYRAIFISAYYGMLRIGEVTSGDHPIKAANLHLGENKDKLLLVLRTSKAHGLNNKPQQIKISERRKHLQGDKQHDMQVCPFLTIREFINLRPKIKTLETEPFFVFRDRSPVKPKHACRILSMTITVIGLNQSVYLFHGFRGGRASDLFAMGVSVETIKKLGRWRSNAVYTYLR